MTEEIQYKYSGARSLVSLHEKHLKLFYKTWKEAKMNNLALPSLSDLNYKSLKSLLLHVLKWAETYMNWMVENLNLDYSSISEIPKIENITKEADEYIDQLLDWWGKPLSQVDRKEFHNKTFLTPWKANYSIEEMLEHAVMHPIRHREQLQNYLDSSK